MALILNGDTGITYPVATATGSATQASAGRVLQVVQGTTATETSTTTSTYITTTLSLSITPSSATSKILVFGQIFIVCSTGGTQPTITLFRGASNLVSPAYGFGDFYSTASGYTETVLPFSFLVIQLFLAHALLVSEDTSVQ